jgi:hypothetical protein
MNAMNPEPSYFVLVTGKLDVLGCELGYGRVYRLPETDAIAGFIVGTATVCPTDLQLSGGAKDVKSAFDELRSPLVRAVSARKPPPSGVVESLNLLRRAMLPVVLARAQARGWDFLLASSVRTMRVAGDGEDRAGWVSVTADRPWIHKGRRVEAGATASVWAVDAIIPCLAGWMRGTSGSDAQAIETARQAGMLSRAFTGNLALVDSRD